MSSIVPLKVLAVVIIISTILAVFVYTSIGILNTRLISLKTNQMELTTRIEDLELEVRALNNITERLLKRELENKREALKQLLEK